MFSQIIPPLQISRHQEPSLKCTKKRFWIALLALIGFTLCAEDLDKGIEPYESDDSVTVQPNGYFEFSTSHHLSDEIVSYGDLVDIVNQLTADKLMSLRNDEESHSQETSVPTSTLNKKRVSSRTERTWKRRILVLLDGDRVTGTADSTMKIEDHIGKSLNEIKSLEGFLSTDVNSIQHTDPRVLNFVSESPNHRKTDTNESKDLEPEKTQS